MAETFAVSIPPTCATPPKSSASPVASLLTTTVRFEKPGASRPDSSCTGLLPGVYSSVTASPPVTAAARVSVTVLPETDTLDGAAAVPSTVTAYALAAGVEPVSRSSA